MPALVDQGVATDRHLRAPCSATPGIDARIAPEPVLGLLRNRCSFSADYTLNHMPRGASGQTPTRLGINVMAPTWPGERPAWARARASLTPPTSAAPALPADPPVASLLGPPLHPAPAGPWPRAERFNASLPTCRPSCSSPEQPRRTAAARAEPSSTPSQEHGEPLFLPARFSGTRPCSTALLASHSPELPIGPPRRPDKPDRWIRGSKAVLPPTDDEPRVTGLIVVGDTAITRSPGRWHGEGAGGRRPSARSTPWAGRCGTRPRWRGGTRTPRRRRRRRSRPARGRRR